MYRLNYYFILLFYLLIRIIIIIQIFRLHNYYMYIYMCLYTMHLNVKCDGV